METAIYLQHKISKDDPLILDQILNDGLKSKNLLGYGNQNFDDHNCVFFSIFDERFIPNKNTIIIKANGSETVYDHSKPKIQLNPNTIQGGVKTRYVSSLQDFDISTKTAKSGIKCSGMPEIAFC